MSKLGILVVAINGGMAIACWTFDVYGGNPIIMGTLHAVIAALILAMDMRSESLDAMQDRAMEALKAAHEMMDDAQRALDINAEYRASSRLVVKWYLDQQGHDCCHENRIQLAKAFCIDLPEGIEMPDEAEYERRCAAWRRHIYHQEPYICQPCENRGQRGGPQSQSHPL